MNYPKIDTLFDRDEKTFKVDVTKFRRPEFEQITEWEASEKADGANIKVAYEVFYECYIGQMGLGTMTEAKGREVNFYGRKEGTSDIPKHLLKYLKETFTLEKFEAAFPKITGDETVYVYGEGYGEKIQKAGKHYTESGVKFRVFDVYIEDFEAKMGGWWLESENIKDVAKKLGVETVPILGMMTTDEIVAKFTPEMIKARSLESIIQMCDNPDHKQVINMEGIIARSKPLLFNRQGERVLWKLKVKDFPR